MTGSLEQWITSAVMLASIWLRATAKVDPAWLCDGRDDDVTVLASLLIV